ncbi:MAG: hypothetical protein AABW46_03605, partial [Nanoarchaeota archaeon]
MKKLTYLFLIVLLNVGLVYSQNIEVPSSATVVGCGDGFCSSEEDCNNCRVDCGECFTGESTPSGGGAGGGGSRYRNETPAEVIEPKPPKICEEYWICDEWSNCVDHIQIRECYDLEECDTLDFKPNEERTCGIVFLQQPPIREEFNFYPFFILLVLLI